MTCQIPAIIGIINNIRWTDSTELTVIFVVYYLTPESAMTQSSHAF